MSYEKQALNGAYYGPSIPPPPNTYHRPRSGGRGLCGRCGCCLFDCLCDCGCCLLGCVFKIIFSILIVIGLLILVFWLIVHPNEVKFYATKATLTQFNLTNSSNTLNYNLSVDFSVRNPNRKIGLYYDEIEARGYYEGQRFDSIVLNETFYQGHKNTTDFGPVNFEGQHVVLLGSGGISNYDEQKKDGVYHVQVKLYLKVRFKFGLIKTGKYKPKVKCDLKVPLKGVSGAAAFEVTRCDYDL